MTSVRRHWLSMPAMPLVLVLCGGCASSMLSPLMDDGRYVSGTWTGRLVSVTVRDARNRTFDAAALEVDGGPRLPPELGTVPEHQGGGNVPLLSRSWERPLLILPPEGLPVGKRVRVRGRMETAFLRAPGRGATVYPINRGERYGEVEAEHVILLRGEPQVLKQ